MDNEQLLQAISEMLDKSLQPINARLDKMDARLDKMDARLDKMDARLDMMEVIVKRTVKKLDDLQLDVKIAEREIRQDIHDLNDEMETVIQVLKMNEILPR